MITKMYNGIDTVDIALKLLKRVPGVDSEITIYIDNSLRLRCCHASEIEHITRFGSLGRYRLQNKNIVSWVSNCPV